MKRLLLFVLTMAPVFSSGCKDENNEIGGEYTIMVNEPVFMPVKEFRSKDG